MKKFIHSSTTSKLVLAILLGSLSVAQSYATLIAYDGFDVPGNYTGGVSVNGINGGTGWTSGWNAGGFDAQTSSPAYTDLITTPGEAKIITNFDFNITSRTFSPISTGDLWVSWLYTASNTGYAGLGVTRTGGGEIFYIGTDGGGQIRIDSTNAGGSNNATVMPITNGTSYFIVANINYAAGTFATYVNPAVSGGPGSPTVSSTSGTLGEVGSLLLLGFGNGVTGFDEIRLGTTYGDVAPAAIPEPSTFAALAGAGMLGYMALRRRRR